MPPNDSPSGTRDGLGNAFHYGEWSRLVRPERPAPKELGGDHFGRLRATPNIRRAETNRKAESVFRLEGLALLLIELRLRRKRKAKLAKDKSEYPR
ncbi:hypothetical protein ACSQ67_025444 [Phaseolus vulgaris]